MLQLGISEFLGLDSVLDVDFLLVFIALLVLIYMVYRCLMKVRGNEEPVEPPKLGEEPITKITDVWTLQEIHPYAKIP